MRWWNLPEESFNEERLWQKENKKMLGTMCRIYYNEAE